MVADTNLHTQTPRMKTGSNEGKRISEKSSSKVMNMSLRRHYLGHTTSALKVK